MATKLDTDVPKGNAVLGASNLYRKQRTPEGDPFSLINDPSVPQGNPFGLIDPDYVSKEEAARDPSKEASVDIEKVEDGLGETFRKSVKSGVLGIETDINNFNALVASIKGDEQGFDRSIEAAEVAQARSALASEGTTDFKEFVEGPKTFKTVAKQATQAIGQALPYAAGSIAGGIYGAIAGSLGKMGLNLAGRRYLKKKLKDLAEKKIKKKALTPDEEDFLKAGAALTRNVAKGTKRGAMGGAFGFNYPLLAGSSFQEFEEGGQELNATRAWQALGIAIPQAAAEVTGEAFILKTLGKLALKDAAKSGSSLGIKRLAADISKTALKTGVSEAAVEVTQEGISVAQRFAIDDSYTFEQAQLRIGEAAFGGFFAGKAIGGAGAVPASIFSQARQMLSNKQEASAEANEARTTYGASDANLSSPTAEPVKDIDAQINATKNSANAKNVTFIPENSIPKYRATEGTTLSNQDLDRAKETGETVTVDGGFLGYVAGRGFVFTPDADVVTNLQDANADSAAVFEETLATNLDYTNVRPDNPDQVISVKDASGSVVFEQAVDTANDPEGAERALEGAREFANTLPDADGNVGNISPEVTTVEEALRTRKERVDAEGTVTQPQEDDVTVRNMEITSEQIAELENRGLLPPEQARAVQEALQISGTDAPATTSNVINFKSRQALEEFLNTKSDPNDVNQTIRDLVEVNGLSVTFEPDTKVDSVYAEQAVASGVATRSATPTEPQLNPTTLERLDVQEISGNRVIGNANGYSFINYLDPAEGIKRSPDFDERFDSTVALIEDEQARNNIIDNKQYISDSVLDQLANELNAFPGVTPDLIFVETPAGARLFVLRDADTSIDIEKLNNAATQSAIDKTFNTKPETVTKIKSQSPFELVHRDKNGNVIKKQVLSMATILNLGREINSNVEQRFVGDSSSTGAQRAKLNFYAGISYLITHVNQKKGKFRGTTYTIDYKSPTNKSLDQVVTVKDERGNVTSTKQIDGKFPPNKSIVSLNTSTTGTAGVGDINKLRAIFKYDNSTKIFPDDKTSGLKLSNLVRIPDVNTTATEFQEEAAGQESETEAVNLVPEWLSFRLSQKVKPEETMEVKEDTNLDQREELYVPYRPPGKKQSLKNQLDIKYATSSVLNGFIKKLTNVYKLNSDPIILTLEDIKNLLEQSKFGGPDFWSDTKLFSFPSKTIPEILQQRDAVQSFIKTLTDLAESMEKGNVKGSTIKSRYLASPLIVLKSDAALTTSVRDFGKLTNAQQQNLIGEVSVALHEHGHLIFDQQFDELRLPKNKNIKIRLWNAFKTARNNLNVQGQGVGQYNQQDQKKAFEEWYADQVAAYVNKLVLAEGSKRNSDINKAKPKNIVDKYFKTVASIFMKVQKAFESGANTLYKRFKSDTTFAEYFDGVLKANQQAQNVDRVASQEASTTEDYVVDNYITDIKLTVPPSAVKKLTAAIRKVLSVGGGSYLQKFLKLGGPVTTFYRSLGPAGEKLANFWNKKSQTIGPEGYNDVRVTKRNEFLNELEKIVGVPITEWGQYEALFALVEDDTQSTDSLPPKAKKIREFLEQTVYDDYIINKQTGESFIQTIEYDVDPVTGEKTESGRKPMGRLKNYYPRLLNIAQISQNPTFFKDLILTELTKARDNGTLDKVLDIDLAQATDEQLRTEVDKIVTKIANKATVHGAALELGNDNIADVGLGAASERVLEFLTTAKIREYENAKGIPNEILHPPQYAILPYLAQVVKKVEFERRGGAATLDALVEEIVQDRHPQDSEKREALRNELYQTFDGLLGRAGADISEGFKTFNSIATVWTVFTTLSMATFSSFTDLGAIATRSKEFGNVKDLMHELKSTMSIEEYRQLAKDLGVTSSEAVATAYLTPGDLDWQQKWASSSLDWFFKATLLTQYTNFTRELAVGMGKRFVINSAARDTQRNTRYLAELGLTRAEVKQWQADGENFNSEVGQKVGSAIRQFADESIIRPDPGQRPNWANSPYWQIVFSLKSYFYSYGTTVLGGIGREFKNRYAEDGHINGGAALLLMGAGTMLPLAMIGLETREWIKYLGQMALPGVDASKEVFRSDFMSWPEYVSDIANRAGIYGPWTIVESAWSGMTHGDNPLVSQIPIIDLADQVLFEDNLARAFPFINNLGVEF